MRRITIITETFLPELNGVAMTLHRMICDYWQVIKDLEETDSKEWWQHSNCHLSKGEFSDEKYTFMLSTGRISE